MSDSIESLELDGETKFVFDSRYKKQLLQYGLFWGVLVVVFFILLLFTLAGRDSWEYGLRGQVAEVLSGSDVELDFSLGQLEPVDSPFAVSCAAFPLIANGADEGTDGYAVIIRIPTLFGPLPAVYLYKRGQDAADFVGFATLNGRVAATVEDNARHTQIAYWRKRIPSIIVKD